MSTSSTKRPLSEAFDDTAGAKKPKEVSEKGIADTTQDIINNSTDHRSNLFTRISCFGSHKKAVSSVSVAPSKITKKNGILTASASSDGTCRIWDISLEQEQQEHSLTPHTTLSGHTRGINEATWHPTLPLVATVSDDHTALIWDAVATSDKPLLECTGHSSFCFCADFSHTLLVTGSFDETIKLWDLRTGDCITTIPAHSDPVTGVAFNRDGTCVVSASHDGLLRLWDVATGECLKTLYAAGNAPVSSVTFAPNSQYILAGALESVLRLWPVRGTTTGSQTNAVVRTYGKSKTRTSASNRHHHINTKYSIVADFISDGQSIVTGSENNNVVLYDLQTTEVQQVCKAHTQPVLAVSAHDAQTVFCSGGMDQQVYWWRKG